jgi:hypothetical protein
MKRKKGRPKGKAYPKPHTSAEGFDTAIYGKLGASEAMSLLRDCPYPTIDFIRKSDPKIRDRVEKKLLKWAPKLEEGWLRRIGPTLGKKIAAGDGKFFRELGDAVEEFAKSYRPVDSIRRYLAIECKLYCDAMGEPFTCKRLCDYYKVNSPGDVIDSSTVSKLRRWALSVKPSNEGLIQDLGPPRIRMQRVRQENQILKP